jgi:hypothetical protein
MTARATRPWRSHADCCVVSACEEAGCAIRLPSNLRLRQRGCLNGTIYGKNHNVQGSLCDCMIFWANNQQVFAAAIELKSGGADASEVGKQLQSGANVIDDIATGVQIAEFFPILASNSMSTTEVRLFRRVAIKFRGTDYSPIRVKCNASLAQIVKKHSAR